MPKQILSRARGMESRAAEILRILYRVRPGLGEKLSRKEVYDELVARRAVDSPTADHDKIRDVDGSIVTRPSKHGVANVSESVSILIATGLAIRIKPGIFAITEAGRAEAEIWFPELTMVKSQ